VPTRWRAGALGSKLSGAFSFSNPEASMRRTHGITFALAAGLFLAPGAAVGQDGDRAVAGGGITVDGWHGVVDAGAAARGASLDDALLAAQGQGLHVKTGPATTYWRDQRLTGDYTVRATFREPAYMALNDHPHPYGIVIAGNGMGTDAQRFLYCAAYGNGRFIVRGFGPEPFQMNGRRAQEHEAVHQAAGRGEPVTQEIAVSVRGNTVQCAINGTVVASYEKSEVVGDGKLSSTDGVYGLRFAHNTEAVVTGLTVDGGS
jgi:hypothetical protein